MAGGPITSVVPVHHGHRPDLDRHRAHPGRARRRRLPGRGRRRGAQHPPLDHARRATPAAASTRTGSSPTPPSAASARRSSPRPSSSARASAAPTSPTSASTATGCRRRWSPSCGRQLRAGEPFVYAYYDGIDKVSHEYGLERVLRRRARGRPTGWWPTCSSMLPPRRRAGGHRRPRPGRRGRPARRAAPRRRPPTSSFQSGEGRFRWLHARPGPRRRAARGRGRPPRRRRLGAHPRRDDRRGLVGPARSPSRPRPSGRRRPRHRGTTSPSRDPADTGPFTLVGRHGSLTEAEMFVPLPRGVSFERHEPIPTGPDPAGGGPRRAGDASAGRRSPRRPRSGGRRSRSRPRSCGSAR